MSKNKVDELTDSEIQMYLDGHLKGARKVDLENRIAVEPAIRERIVQYSCLDKEFNKHFGTSAFLKKETVKETVKKPSQSLFAQWRMATAFAMGLLVSFLLLNFSSIIGQSSFAQEAVIAHFKYSPELHLDGRVKTLAFDKEQNVSNTFIPPNLEPVGLELVGVRHLVLQEGKSVQLMYHDDKGERYTVIITQNPKQKAPQKPDFYNTQLAQVSYWGNKKYNFAITAVKEGLDVRDIQPMIAANF